MSQEARDSGIIADNDHDSLSSTSSMTRDCNQLSYVQRLRKQFEILAKEQEREFHSECNWWLENESEEARNGEGEKVVAKENAPESRKATSAPSTPVKSPLIMPQLSHESRKTPSAPSTPVKSPPATVQEVPIFILNDGEDENDDSFDSDSASDEEEEIIADEAEVEEANLEVGSFRHSNNSFKLSPK